MKFPCLKLFTTDLHMSTPLELPVSVSSSLRILDISHNSIRGSISPQVREVFDAADDIKLSSNKITGTLDIRAARGSMTATTNRLSGYIHRSDQPENPHEEHSNYVEESPVVDVLCGNYFNCRSTADLPPHDPHAHDYVCGSKIFDSIFITWIVLILTVVALGAFVYIQASTEKQGRLVDVYMLLRELLWVFPQQASLKRIAPHSMVFVGILDQVRHNLTRACHNLTRKCNPLISLADMGRLRNQHGMSHRDAGSLHVPENATGQWLCHA